ncbi:hypothetical protein HYPSUDRAFT_528917 [Hypholoma sublateritium FD-334 SS-4]|uniref:Uncharacterized protein n=1 Tax=Hypholoma sublateritium (strain FD-334 SS-4) TaxID=945553 RepID=A0A0D2MKX4_HYPSF|nr:hypothetical protein HYPSUDRAFT_528917 [Hypholoma sublateritium FD-334 SS-4]
MTVSGECSSHHEGEKRQPKSRKNKNASSKDLLAAVQHDQYSVRASRNVGTNQWRESDSARVVSRAAHTEKKMGYAARMTHAPTFTTAHSSRKTKKPHPRRPIPMGTDEGMSPFQASADAIRCHDVRLRSNIVDEDGERQCS